MPVALWPAGDMPAELGAFRISLRFACLGIEDDFYSDVVDARFMTEATCARTAAWLFLSCSSWRDDSDALRVCMQGES